MANELSLEERMDRVEKLINMILDNMSMRNKTGETKNHPQEHFKSFLEKEDKE